jgi:hypothetical protein
VDMTLKMYTRPVLQLDPNMLTDAILDEKEKREALLQKLGVEETALASNQQFAALLEKLNVVPPTKTSKTTGKETLALAKTMPYFKRYSTVNVKTLPFFVKRVFGLNLPRREPEHSDSLTSAKRVRSLSHFLLRRANG